MASLTFMAFPARRGAALLVGLAVGAASWACGGASSDDEGQRTYDLDPQLVFWEELQSLCGAAYEGSVTVAVPPDSVFEEGPVRVHVASCDVAEVRMALTVGEDASRTWLVSPTPVGLRLEHVHRHQDGTEAEISGYGGETRGPGTETRQDFHADAYTAELVPAAAENVWTLEIHPDSALVYGLRRPGSERRFRLLFDLGRTVPPPSEAR